MSVEYPYKSFHKGVAIALIVIGVIATALNFLTGSPVAIAMLFTVFVGVMQVKQYSKPYIIIEGGLVTVQMTTFKTIHFKAEDISRVEEKGNKIILHLQDGSKKPIFLNYLSPEDKARLKSDFKALAEGEEVSASDNLSDHLVE